MTTIQSGKLVILTFYKMAKKIILSLLKQLLFWIVFFDFIRLIFVINHLHLILVEKIGFFQILGIFWYSFPLDLATTCYILVLPFFFLFIQSVTNFHWNGHLRTGEGQQWIRVVIGFLSDISNHHRAG